MIFSLGHSVLSASEFVQAARGIDIVIDVRSHPGSKHVPHFSQLEMGKWLPEYGIDYEWWPQLGGWGSRHYNYIGEMLAHNVDVLAYMGKKFPKHRIAAERKGVAKPTWQNQGLYDYSWFMTTREFLEGMDKLIANHGAKDQKRTALVCAEAQWWRCHRSMLADYLVWQGLPCYHLPTRLPKRETTPRFQSHADRIGNRLKRYEPEILEVWKQWILTDTVSGEAQRVGSR